MLKIESKIDNQQEYNHSFGKESKPNKKTKKVNYNDYLKLKNAYLNLQENSQKIKEENDQLNTLLQAFQEEINKSEDYKLKINQSFQIIEKKYTDLFNENKELKKINENKYNENINNEKLEEENNNYKLIIEELNNQIKQYQIVLLNKNNEIENIKNINNNILIEKEENINNKEKEINEEKELIKQKIQEINDWANKFAKREE